MNRQTNDVDIYTKDSLTIEPPERFDSISLVQLADITARLGWQVSAHVQFCHEIIMILEGEAVMAYNAQRFHIAAGQMVMIPEGIIHDVRYVSPVHTRMLLLGVRLGEDTDPQIRNIFEALIQENMVRICNYPSNVRTVFEMLIDEYFNREKNSHQMLASLMNVVILQFCRQYTDVPREPLSSLRVDSSADLLTIQMCQYIRKHAIEMTSLEELSREFSYSYSYLSHHFKREAGYSIKDYWDHYRFQHVLQLMRDPTLSITQIAERVHYQSIHTFSRSFRTKFGMSPTEYRKVLNT